MYHLSNSKNPMLLVPRIPSNYMTRQGFEEACTPRVCFTSSIDGCLMALSQKCEGQVFYVHEPVEIDPSQIVSNAILVKNKWVPDARLTGELWYLQPIETKVTGMITVHEAFPTPYPYEYGSHAADLYKWNYTETRL